MLQRVTSAGGSSAHAATGLPPTRRFPVGTSFTIRITRYDPLRNLQITNPRGDDVQRLLLRPVDRLLLRHPVGQHAQDLRPQEAGEISGAQLERLRGFVVEAEEDHCQDFAQPQDDEEKAHLERFPLRAMDWNTVNRDLMWAIVYRPLGSKIWSPLPENGMAQGQEGWGFWQYDLLKIRKRCQHLNSLNIQYPMRDGVNRLEFRLARIEIQPEAELPIAGPPAAIP